MRIADFEKTASIKLFFTAKTQRRQGIPWI
jgi:hypothetical protein